jgi:hypothetical protein
MLWFSALQRSSLARLVTVDAVSNFSRQLVRARLAAMSFFVKQTPLNVKQAEAISD